VAYPLVEKQKLGSTDYREMWTLEANQPELERLLNVLFALSNDLDLDEPDGRPGPRPRVVFILGGDCHFGLMHMVVSDRDGGPDHRRNPNCCT
jgi:hypothetical protein